MREYTLLFLDSPIPEFQSKLLHLLTGARGRSPTSIYEPDVETSTRGKK